MAGYIACEHIDFYWERADVRKVEALWRNGSSIDFIATALDRSADDVNALILDRLHARSIRRRSSTTYEDMLAARLHAAAEAKLAAR